MSYSGLIADAHHAQARREEFLDEIIFFVVERRAAQVRHRLVLHQALAVLLFYEILVPAFPQPISDHIHRLFEVELFPFGPVWPSIAYFPKALRVRRQFIARGPFWAEPSARKRRRRVALNRNELIAFVKDKLSAADRTVRANGMGYFGAVVLRAHVERVLGHRFHTRSIRTIQDLFYNRPAGNKVFDHAPPRTSAQFSHCFSKTRTRENL